ncbi:PREDICTED: uncharacterized protein LOC108660689 [Theobroma cacao]|uniref:Uncharacterized protein LOC108660689 n=1 Tax=Theobroma cacao TaxID=3641 RepID=A0AB32VX20_THECC|nr:PREDICTED: uncharacterized protein LOC108660689 [Theobroma cacao]
MPSYIKFLKDILSKKRRLGEFETVVLIEECIAIIQNKPSPKFKDPSSFTIPCTISTLLFAKALSDLGASINLMLLYIYRKLGLGEIKLTSMTLQLTDRSFTYLRGIVEDVLVKVDFQVNFIVLHIEEDRETPIILGRLFLATTKALIDVKKGELTLKVQDQELTFNIFKAIKFPQEFDECFAINIVNKITNEVFIENYPNDPLEASLISTSERDDDEFLEFVGCSTTCYYI